MKTYVCDLQYKTASRGSEDAFG